MYCINCGVKLSDTEKACPLCGTTVYHPELTQKSEEPLYPQNCYPKPRANSKGGQIVMITVFLLPLIITVLCDLQVSGRITWSGYVIGALLLCYELLVLPTWFQKPNPAIFVPCGFAAVALYLLYIDLATQGGWFVSFALPVTGIFCLVITAVVTLLQYVPKGALYILGGAAVALGAAMPLMGFLLNLTFFYPHFALWSLYPLTALVLLGGMLIFLAICRPARQTMERKFFI